MKIQLNQELKDLKGNVLEEGEKKEAITLKSICVNALLSPLGEKKGEEPDGTEKMRRFCLAEKIEKANEIDLKSEDIVKIKNIVGQGFNTIIVGQVFKMLENN